MDKKIISLGMVTAVICLLVAGLAFGDAVSVKPINQILPVTQVDGKVTTQGTYQKSVSPDEAYIYLGVKTDGKTAQEAKQENSEAMDEVRKALYKMGVDKDDIETSYFYVNPIYNWKSGYQELIGYQAVHQIKVKTDNLDDVGKIIDGAVKAGANMVSNVQFGLSDQKKEKLNQDILGEAAKDAKTKAKILAEALGAKLGEVIEITENSYYYPYYRTSSYAGAEMADAKIAAPTQIDPRDVTVSASVTVSFKLV